MKVPAIRRRPRGRTRPLRTMRTTTTRTAPAAASARTAAGTAPAGRLRCVLRDDRGQAAVEFLGMTPLIAAVLIVLWQAVLIGYTFTLAGSAADQAVHAGAQVSPWKDRGAACREAGEEDLPSAWRDGADIGCYADNALVHAHADLKVPLLYPGFINMPITIPGNAAAARES